MKAILVIDMPKCCFGCPCYDKSDYADGCLAIGYRKSTSRKLWSERAEWCPLKPLPQKKDSDGTLFTESHIYKSGWNDCLKEIERG